MFWQILCPLLIAKFQINDLAYKNYLYPGYGYGL